MVTLSFPDLQEEVNREVVSKMDKLRYENYLMEKEAIMNLNNAQDIVTFMRKMKDSVNTRSLMEKALAYQDEVMPLVLEKLCKSGHDIFIENAATLLAGADEKYTEQLYDIFPNIRNTYARSELCLVFGVMKKTEYTPLLMEQFRIIKEERPDRDYEQGPLFALYTDCSKIEKKVRRRYIMAVTTPTQIRIEENVKKQAVELLEGLGLNLSDAVNMFLRQVILRNGLPFEVKYPELKPEVVEAMEEARRISRDPNVKGYTDVDELFEDLNS